MKKLLVTGGSGYIGSHTVVELLSEGHHVVILDNLSNSSKVVIDRIEMITGQRPEFVEGDIRDMELMRELFDQHNFDAVIHFAGLKSVAESVADPARYREVNILGTECVLECMQESGCKHLVFSSSATVYGDPSEVPISEEAELTATNPYGETKLAVESMLHKLNAQDSSWKITILRYFNPVAAHVSGLIGEDPSGVPNNLMPYIAQVAVGKLGRLAIFGNDYPTPDGTGVRDYIHVVDLARAHLMALSGNNYDTGPRIYNIGTGKGFSVLEVLRAFESAAQVEIPYSFKPRREGDVAKCFADASLAAKELGWEAVYDLARMMEDHWRWQRSNPKGY